MTEPTDYWKIGAVAGALGMVLLGWISKIVSMVPGVSLDLQAISVSSTGLGTVINTGLSTYAKKLFGIVPIPITGMGIVYAAIGGAATIVLGAYVVQNVKQLQFAKTKLGKLATIFVIAGIATGWILAQSITIPALSGVIIMAVDALVLSYILIYADDSLNTKLIP